MTCSKFLVTIPKGLSFFFVAFLVNTNLAMSQSTGGTGIAEKALYIPGKIYCIPENNNYNNDTSAFSYQRMVQSSNIVIFWHKEFGQDPAANPNAEKRFNVHEAATELERFYNYYVNDLKLVQKGKFWTDKYKMILYVIGGEGGTCIRRRCRK